MRERGLKLTKDRHPTQHYPSLPMRERGLKLGILHFGRDTNTSLPMRERGLKRFLDVVHLQFLGRSPCGSVD